MAAETRIILETIKCNNPSEPLGDSIYIKYVIDSHRGRAERVPSSKGIDLKKGEVWPINLPLNFKETAVVELYEYDFPGTDELLGTHVYAPSDPQPETVQIINRNGADYSLHTKNNNSR
jgi:hypothetical protein